MPPMRIPILLLSAGLCLTLTHAAELPFLYPQSDAFRQQLAKTKLRNIVLIDYHIHIRGGMILEKAIRRQDQSGIKSAVLENFGRE